MIKTLKPSIYDRPSVALVDAFTKFSQTSAILSISIGILVFLAWAFNLNELKTIAQGWPSMKVNTSIAFIFAGLSLLLLLPKRVSSNRHWLGILFAVVCALIGFLTLCEYIFEWDLNIDNFMFQDLSNPELGVSIPGRMSPITALNFVLVGVSLCLLNTKLQTASRLRGLLSLIVTIISFFIILLYTYGEPVLPYEVESYTQMAIHTAGVFFTLSLGILFSRHYRDGITALLTSNTPGAILLRWTIPTILVVLFLLGWIRIYGEHAGLFGKVFGLSLNILLFALFVVSLIFNITKKLDRSEKEKIVLTEQLIEEANFRKNLSNITALIMDSLDAVVGMDSEGKIIEWNRQAEVIFGWERADTIGQKLSTLIVPDQYREAHEKGLNQFLKTEVRHISNKRVVLSALHRTGREFPMELSVIPVKESHGWLFYAFVRDISDLKEFEQQQKDLLAMEHLARLAAEQSVNMRDDFLSIAAHELRTPITPISMQLQLMERALEKGTDNDFPSPIKIKLLKWTTSSRKEVDRLARLAEELLDVTRISAGRLQLNLEEVNLSKIVHSQIQRNATNYSKAESDFHTHIEPGVIGKWDRLRLESLVENLLTNAIKYGSNNPIEVKVEIKGTIAIFSVKDNGIGISKDDQLRIFKKFERASSVKDFSGLGLGLYISNEIVKAHGGSIKLESEPLKGSTFQVELPLGI